MYTIFTYKREEDSMNGSRMTMDAFITEQQNDKY